MQESRRLRQLVPLVLCLGAFGLRLGPLWINRFHPDEALYSSWALAIAYGRDRLLAQAVLDKPPLPFYLMAGAFFILGRAEIAARLVSLIASVGSVALTWQLAHKLRVPPSIATIALALSPLAILFSPTAFLDPLMVTFMLASLVVMTRKQSGWAGLWLGLATTTKVEALVFLPLVLACGAVESFSYPKDAEARSVPRSGRLGVLARFLIGLALPWIAVLTLDHIRGGTSFWVNMTTNYGGTRPIYASEVVPRLIGWARLLPYVLGWPMSIGLAIGLPTLLIYDLTHDARKRAATLDLVLIEFTLGYVLLHWLLAIPIWDRYLLGLVPVTSLLVARLADWLRDHFADLLRSSQFASLTTALVVMALMAFPASLAFKSILPVGGDHGSQDSIDRVSNYMRGYPYGTVLYDHWLGWSLRYYLWDATSYVAYFSTPESLATDLRVFGRTSTRFIIFPATETTMRIERAIAAEGFVLSPALTTRDRRGQPTFSLYRIEPLDARRPTPSRWQ